MNGPTPHTSVQMAIKIVDQKQDSYLVILGINPSLTENR